METSKRNMKLCTPLFIRKGTPNNDYQFFIQLSHFHTTRSNCITRVIYIIISIVENIIHEVPPCLSPLLHSPRPYPHSSPWNRFRNIVLESCSYKSWQKSCHCGKLPILEENTKLSKLCLISDCLP